MNRRAVLTALCILWGTGSCLAQDWPAGTVTLTAPQIDRLLRGNTTIGAWAGTGYRQYFDATGATIYLAEAAPPDRGRWRVNAETDEYESWWERSGWAGYTIVMTNEGYAWVNRDRLEPFTVLEGERLQQ